MASALFAKVQSLLILLNRQRVERTQASASDQSPPGSMMPPPRPHLIGAMPYGEHPLHPAPVRGRSLVLNSSFHLLQAFMFFWYRRPAVLISWTMGQQAFNACMILILDALETEMTRSIWLVEHAYVVFTELQNKGVHNLATLAVRRISDGLAMLGQRQQQREQASLPKRQPGHQNQPTLQIDTASMTDFSGDTVMGNTGMFLLEDPGLQSHVASSFQPLGWNIAGGSAHPSSSSNPTTPNIPSPVVPISQVAAAPFPAISSPFTPPALTGGPMMPTSYAVGGSSVATHFPHYQPQRRTSSSSAANRQQIQQPQSVFTPINTTHEIPIPPKQHHSRYYPEQPPFSQLRGPRRNSQGSGNAGPDAGPQSIHYHRLDRPPRSQQRRK